MYSSESERDINDDFILKKKPLVSIVHTIIFQDFKC